MSRRLPLLLSMAALLLLAVVVAHGSSGIPQGRGLVIQAVRQPTLTQSGRTPPSHPPTVPGGGFAVALVIVLFAAALVLAGVAAVATLLTVRRRRRNRTAVRNVAGTDDEAASAVTGSALLRGARHALAELRRRPGEPPGDTVQRAWLSLERAAAETGTERRPEHTPTEFTTALLAAHHVDPAALAALRGRYQRARFAEPGTITEADAVTAVDALARIADDLAAALTPEPEEAG